MKSGHSKKKIDFQTASLLFFLVSLFGWIFETVICYVQSGEYCDRGFLSLPFCPIYGVPVCLIYYWFGRPTDGLFYRLLSRENSKGRGQGRVFRKFLSVTLYFLASGIIATGAELVVGLSLKWAGLSLWSYNGVPFCFLEVVCLPVSFVWGALITLFSQFILPPIECLFLRIPKKIQAVLNALLWTALIADFAYNVAYYLVNGSHLEFE